MSKLVHIKVFMASPSDVIDERKLFTETINSFNRSIAHNKGYHIEPIVWDKYAYPDTHDPQSIINKLLDDAELLIVVFWNNFGAPTRSFPSGTMEEFSIAFERQKDTGIPAIKVYFKKSNPPSTLQELKELEKILKFKESISDKALYKVFNDPNEFASLLNEHLSSWFFDFIAKPKKETSKSKSKQRYSEPMLCRNLMKETFKKVERNYEKFIEKVGKRISFGITDLDEISGVIEDYNLIVIAGDDSCGKTSLILNLINNSCVTNKVPVLFFGMRNNKQNTILKLLCNKAEIAYDRIAEGYMKKSDWHKITAAAGKLIETPLIIDDNTFLSISKIREIISSFKKIHETELVIIDGLNYISDKKGILGGELISISRYFNIPIICSIRINTPTRIDKRPQKRDLNEFKDLYSEADMVIFLYRKSLYTFNEHDTVEAIIAKNRDSFTGTVKMLFFPRYSMLMGLTHDEMTDEEIF